MAGNLAAARRIDTSEVKLWVGVQQYIGKYYDHP